VGRRRPSSTFLVSGQRSDQVCTGSRPLLNACAVSSRSRPQPHRACSKRELSELGNEVALPAARFALPQPRLPLLRLGPRLTLLFARTKRHACDPVTAPGMSPTARCFLFIWGGWWLINKKKNLSFYARLALPRSREYSPVFGPQVRHLFFASIEECRVQNVLFPPSSTA
jgi:hypothetical protein